ncbi:MAG: hypothetical protein IJ429_00495 [Lachnospiraceae bacterium]|nr:hypothetical protein [Lachnospiraceae bacterium]
MRSKVNRNRVVCLDWYETEEYMWMCLADRNAICKVNKETKEVTVLGHYPETEYAQENLSFTVVRNGDKLVFLPYCADYVAIMDMNTEKLEFISIKKCDYKDYDRIGKFATGFIKDEYVYMFGMWYPAIVRLNVDSAEMDYFYYKDCVEGTCTAPYSQLGCAQVDDELILATGKKGYVIKYDVVQNKGELKRLANKEISFFGITKDEQHIWMTFEDIKEKTIGCWNVKTNKTKMIPIPDSGLYYPPVIYKEHLYLFPFEGTKVQVLDLRNGECRMQEKISELIVPGGEWARIMAVKQRGDIIKFQTGGSRCWYEYDMKSSSLQEEYFEIDDIKFAYERKRKKKQEIEKAETDFAERQLLLTEYVQMIDRKMWSAQNDADGCGENIYQTLKRL